MLAEQEHKERHKKLHKNLDELVADYISITKKGLTVTNLMEFIEWSYQQTINPKK